jgi:hypothetical protein
MTPIPVILPLNPYIYSYKMPCHYCSVNLARNAERNAIVLASKQEGDLVLDGMIRQHDYAFKGFESFAIIEKTKQIYCPKLGLYYYSMFDDIFTNTIRPVPPGHEHCGSRGCKVYATDRNSARCLHHDRMPLVHMFLHFPTGSVVSIPLSEGVKDLDQYYYDWNHEKRVVKGVMVVRLVSDTEMGLMTGRSIISKTKYDKMYGHGWGGDGWGGDDYDRDFGVKGLVVEGVIERPKPGRNSRKLPLDTAFRNVEVLGYIKKGSISWNNHHFTSQLEMLTTKSLVKSGDLVKTLDEAIGVESSSNFSSSSSSSSSSDPLI